MKPLFSIFFFSAFLFASQPIPNAKKALFGFSASKAEVEFLSIGQPGIVKIRGTSNEDGAFNSIFSIQGQNVTGVAKFKIDTLDTGIDLRNSHMKEKYLETKKYPIATFNLTQMALPASFFLGDKFESGSLPFVGTLQLHGITHEVRGTASCKRNSMDLEWAFNFKIQVSDFKIALPSYMGITMSKEVINDIRFETKLTKK